MKKLFLLAFSCVICIAPWAQSVIIDLTTGASNGVLLANGAYDDTWLVRLPNGSTILPRVVKPYNNGSDSWASATCAKWISPQLSANNGSAYNLDSGDYVYETKFNLCFIPEEARVEFSFLGADNEFLELRFNNHLYNLNLLGSDDRNPLRQNFTINFIDTHVVVGQNKIAIKVRNRAGILHPPTPSGMYLCGRFYSSGFFADTDRTICSGECVTIGQPAISNTQYTWTNSTTGQVVGTTAQITVCPTDAVTIYNLTATNNDIDCTGIDGVKIYATPPNNPAFTVDNFCTQGAATFNIRAKPTITNANQVAGFGEMYHIERLSTPYHNTSQGTNPNPSCWWVYPNNVFFWSYTNAQNVTCSTTAPGSFSNNSIYRITRGTWNAYCPWAQHSVLVYGCNLSGAEQRMIASKELDKQAPDLSYLKPMATNGKPKEGVYPNPSNGRFTMATEAMSNGNIEVYSPSGKLLQRITIGKNTNTVVDLSGQPSGTYTAKMITGNKVITEKLVLVR